MSASLTERWAAGETTFGVWSTIDSSFSAELIAAEGPDFFCCDQQHGVLDYQRMVTILQGVRASGAVGISRVPNHDPMLIGKTLDAGAQGVIVPMVRTPGEAAELAAACRYQPHGSRSYGPSRAAITTGSREPRALEQVACILMIETASAVEHVDAIAATPGVDALYVGPADLSLSLGLDPAFERPEPAFREAIDAVLAACRRHGIAAGIQCGDGAMARRHADRGFQLISVATDADALRAAIAAQLAAARGGPR